MISAATRHADLHVNDGFCDNKRLVIYGGNSNLGTVITRAYIEEYMEWYGAQYSLLLSSSRANF